MATIAAKLTPQTQATAYRHGTRNTYQYRKCRCDECRAANTRAHRFFREQRAQRTPPSHGLSTYRNWGCRCEVCTAANAAAGIQQRAKTKEQRRARRLAQWYRANVGEGAW